MKWIAVFFLILSIEHSLFSQDLPSTANKYAISIDADTLLPSIRYKEEMDSFHAFAMQTSGVSRQDSAHEFEWNIATNQWKLVKRLFFNYDAEQNISTIYVKKNTDGFWLRYNLFTYIFDDNNNLVKYLEQNWDGNEWKNYRQTISSFDSNNDKVEEIVQHWSEYLSDGEWENGVKTESTFDSVRNLITQVESRWVDNSWSGLFKHEYTYDTSNLLTYQLVQQSDSGWVNRYQYFYTYDSLRNLIDYRKQSRNWNLTIWINQFRNVYEYDQKNNRILFQRLTTSGEDSWTYDYQYFYTYDEFNNQINQTKQYFQANTWQDYDKYDYGYNTDQNRISEVHHQWNGAWANIDSSYYFFNEITGLPEQPLHPEFELFPNPATNSLSVVLPLILSKESSIEIYSSNGKKVSGIKTESSNPREIDISHLVPGSYYLIISNLDYFAVRDFIKI